MLHLGAIDFETITRHEERLGLDGKTCAPDDEVAAHVFEGGTSAGDNLGLM